MACQHLLMICFILCDIVHYFLLLVGMEPLDVLVALKPRQLLAGIASGVSLDALHGFFQRPASVQIVEQFFVSYRVQCVDGALVVKSANFVQQSVFHHFIHSLIDALIQFFAVAVQTNLNNVERSFFLFLRAERGVGASCLIAYFQGMDDASVVLLVNDLVVFGVESLSS